MANLMIRLSLVLAVALAFQSKALATTISFYDDITPESMSRLVNKVASAHNQGDRNITVELNSGGGNLGSALIANSKLKAYGVNTLVRHECFSSCTVLFAAGRVRTASTGASFMFHAVHVEHIDSKLRKQGMTSEKAAQTYSSRWNQAIRSASPSLAAKLEKNRTLIRGSDTYYSGGELRRYGYVNN